ncbi:MAG TPA: Ig-like domain-containing protein [Candidatus Dormibacteraeota bacterium]|jgi:Tol biopolymer transport system component
MSWLGGWFDPELEELFRNEPELLETARRVRAARPDAEADPRFRNRLRAQLIAESSRGRGAFGIRRRWHLGPTHVAWGGAALGLALIGATVLTFVSNHQVDRTITAISNLTAQHSVSPDHVITVAFNQPMDELAVERGVHIQPATKVSYSWLRNTLVISPVYHLSGNTPYTVTIAQASIRATSGVSATKPITLTFGTAPTPPPGPSLAMPPTLVPSVLGANGADGSLLFAPDGSVVSTVGLLPQSGAGTPAASPTPAPEGVAGAPAAGSLVDFPASGTPVVLGSAATAAAYSPNHTTLAFAVDDGNGGSKIIVRLSNGSQRQKLVDSPNPVTALSWSSNDRIVYTTGISISAVDRSGKVSTLYSLTGGGTISTLDSGGAYAYVAAQSGTGGDLLNIATGTEQALRGSVADVAFSGDGSTVAWADESTNPVHLFSEAVGQDAPASVSVPGSPVTLADITLDQDGDEVAYLMTNPAGSTQLVVAQLPSGTPLAVATADNASALVLSPAGDQVAFVSNNTDGAAVELAAVPGTTGAHTGMQPPAAAGSTLRAFVDAQVRGDLATLATLTAPGVDVAGSTPRGLSRAYVISTYLNPQGVVTASVELVVDPTEGHTTAGVAGETLSLARSAAGGAYVVNNIVSISLRDQSAGPHVVQVTSSTQGGVTTLQVSFDSDLNAQTIANAISVASPSGAILPSTAVYDPGSRTVTVIIAQAPAGLLTLDISNSLNDVNGQTLAGGFETKVGANS